MEVHRVQHAAQQPEGGAATETQDRAAGGLRRNVRPECQEVGWYQQLKTEQPGAYAAKLNAAASRKKKKKKKQETACPGSVHGRLQPCTECKSIWCHSKSI